VIVFSCRRLFNNVRATLWKTFVTDSDLHEQRLRADAEASGDVIIRDVIGGDVIGRWVRLGQQASVTGTVAVSCQCTDVARSNDARRWMGPDHLPLHSSVCTMLSIHELRLLADHNRTRGVSVAHRFRLTDWLVYSDARNVHPHWIEQIGINHHKNTEGQCAKSFPGLTRINYNILLTHHDTFCNTELYIWRFSCTEAIVVSCLRVI